MAAKVFQRRAVDNRACLRAESLFQNVMRVRACDGVHRVELHPKATLEERAQSFEVEQLFHHCRVVRERINDDDLGLAQAHVAFVFEVYVRVVEGEVFA